MTLFFYPEGLVYSIYFWQRLQIFIIFYRHYLYSTDEGKYCIQPNYLTYPYKRTVKQFRSLQITACVLFVYFLIKVYVVGTHLNCIDLSMQFKWVPTTYDFIKKIKKKKKKKIAYTSANKSFAELLLTRTLSRLIHILSHVFPVVLEKY